MLAGQLRYQLTLLLRNPRTLMAGLILPGGLLALQARGVTFVKLNDVTEIQGRSS